MNNLGMAYLQLGNPRQAIEYLEQAQAVVRQLGNRQGEVAALVNMGSVYHQLGDLRRSMQVHEQVLTIARQLGNRKGESIALTNLGGLYSDLGDDRHAIQCYEQSLAIKSEMGDRHAQIATSTIWPMPTATSVIQSWLLRSTTKHWRSLARWATAAEKRLP